MPLARRVAHLTKHVLVGVDLAHWHVDAVRVGSLSSVRRDLLSGKEENAAVSLLLLTESDRLALRSS